LALAQRPVADLALRLDAALARACAAEQAPVLAGLVSAL